MEAYPLCPLLVQLTLWLCRNCFVEWSRRNLVFQIPNAPSLSWLASQLIPISRFCINTLTSHQALSLVIEEFMGRKSVALLIP